MTVFDDDVDMWEQTWADCLLKGESVDGEHGLTGLVAAVRATADVPPPAPNAALATLLREGLPTVSIPAQRSVPEQVRRWGSRTFRVTVAGVAASLAMGAGVATAAAGSGGPLSYVPEPVKRGVDAAVTAVADVLRSTPETTAPATTDSPATSDSDSGVTGSTGSAPVPAKAPLPSSGPSPATTETAEPVAVTKPPTTPSPTAAPSTETSTSLPSASPSSPSSPSQEASPSPSPTGDTRKPLDNEAPPSPTPTPSESESEQAPTEGEPESSEPVQDEKSATEPAAASSDAPQRDKPGRDELTVERILPSA